MCRIPAPPRRGRRDVSRRAAASKLNVTSPRATPNRALTGCCSWTKGRSAALAAMPPLAAALDEDREPGPPASRRLLAHASESALRNGADAATGCRPRLADLEVLP